MFPRHFTPKCLPVCVTHHELACLNKHVRLPAPSDINNEMKYYLFQLNDCWTRYCSSKYYHNEVQKCEIKFQSVFNQYMASCTAIDQLETTFSRDLDDWRTILLTNPTHSVQFHTRYHTRIAQLKRERRELIKTLILLKLKLLTYIGYPLIKCMHQLISCAPDEFFTQSRNEEKTIVINHLLNWVRTIANPIIPFHSGITEMIISLMEHYCDFKLEREPERFIIRGIDHFHDQCCSNFFLSLDLMKGREEAFMLLLVAKRYQKLNNVVIEKSKALKSLKLLHEVRFLLCNELVLLTASFLYDPNFLVSPASVLWI